MINKIVITRDDAPFSIEIGMHIPDDGLDWADIQYVEMDGKRMNGVPNNIATPLLSSMAAMNRALTPAAAELRSQP